LITQSVKLPVGHMILYPSTSLHRVRSVTRSARCSSIWIPAFQRMESVQLTGVYHNLLRRRAEV